MQILIVGLGSIGRRHARNFKSLGITNIIGFDPSEERRNQFKHETELEVSNDFDVAIQGQPDLTVIASPSRFHLGQALLAAKAGSHLFIEKPLAVSLDGIDELEKVINNKNLFVHVGSNWKFHPAFLTMKRILDENQLGQVTGAQIIGGQWLPDWHPWEDYRNMYSSQQVLGGGVVFDSHEFDYLTWLLGPVKDVQGMTSKTGVLDIDTEDVAVACLRLANNVLATIHIDYIQREYRRRLHVSGSLGTMEWDFSTGKIVLYKAEDKSHDILSVHLDDLNEMYIEQARHILRGVTEGIEPVTPLSSASDVLKILLKLKENHV